ncbi:N-acetylmuramidase domain-containing protein [Pseudoxanthomonas koreensis]|uniref:N-acetylmuramidase domain-containing protein n=1 Tax=Pseudoxanthomonas koreensis TaxID=266061 RepID=UPI00192EACBD|nr:N-acetylmuramidase domain-containing protein [Pseudoxanthomonas koreensis]
MDAESKRTIGDAMWKQLATRLQVEEAALRAVAEVESSGGGFLPVPDARPRILFEGHVFHRLTAGRYGASHPGLSHPKWDRSKYSGSLAGEWKRLDKAAELDPAAAMQAASWGAFQIMGFNYALCGHDSVGRFVEAHASGAEGQLEAFANLLGRPGSPLLPALRRRDWARFARLYNGPAYARNDYDSKLAEAYARHAGPPAAGGRRRAGTRAPSPRRLVAPGRPQLAPLEMLEQTAAGTTRKRSSRVFNVRPDAVDLRDWEYQPPVSSAPRDVRYPPDVRPVLDQGTTSACTGYALAVVIEYLLVRAGRHVEAISPHMLYSMARRYDEWAENDDDAGPEADTGSSLRGALKGWLRHGASSARLWPKVEMPEARPRPEDDWWTDAIKRPLGAYYRIDPHSLRDMHVALDQVGALYASVFTHSGWDALLLDEAVPRPEDPDALPAIKRKTGNPDGGHAIAIVGYTREGFIVHNSWGPAWGKGGLAVLRYGDWLDNAMDCWVAQLGVVTAEHEAIADATSLRTDASGKGVVSGNPVLAAHELSPFIVNMENNGRLSQRGQFRTQPGDVDALLRIHLAQACAKWGIKANQAVDVAIYAHGGLNNEEAAAESARLWVPKLYDEKIFPVFLMWETGAMKTITNLIEDKLSRDEARASGAMQKFKDRWKEWWNQRVEGIARPLGRPLWNEMKENAAKISSNPDSGVRLLFDLYKAKAKEYGLPKLRLHLVGHSAGGILHSHLGAAAIAAGFDLRSVSLLAPAVRVDEFDRTLGKAVLRTGTKLLVAHLSDAAERADPTCKPYGHSLLYLVSRSFEDRKETPLLGLERDLVPARATMAWGAQMMAVSSPGSDIARLPSAGMLEGGTRRPLEATTHGSLDDDKALQRLVFDLIRKA